MKIKNKFEILALIVGLISVAIFTFYLVTNYDKAIIFTEPIKTIRIAEIITGIISIIILTYMLGDRIKENFK